MTSQYWCVDSDATTVYVGKHPLYVTGVLDFKVTVLTDAEDVTIFLANEERLYMKYVCTHSGAPVHEVRMYPFSVPRNQQL